MSDGVRAELRLDDLSVDDRIDAICDHFEREWRAGRQPRIQDYLGDTAGPERSTLFVELVKVDVEYRSRTGDGQPAGEGQLADEAGPKDPTDSDLLRTLNATALPARRLARTFERFELLEKLGEGAFGTVWKAHDPKLDRAVAIKVPRGPIPDSRDADVILGEGRAAAQLKHPNIVGVHEVGLHADVAYIVSEYVDGVDLKQWLSHCALTADDSARLCAKVAEALHHAHTRGIVHRDLKPANILIDRDGEPHIADFGLARRLSAEASVDSEGQLLGTPAYMSPEQAAGDSARVGPLSDLYSLGVIFYELLTGVRPFQGEGSAVIARIQAELPAPPRKLRSGISRDFESICLRAIAKNPDDRYADVAEFAADLRRALQGEPILVGGPRLLQQFRRLSRRDLLVGAASSVCLAGVGAWIASRKGVRAQGPASRRVVLRTEPAGARIVIVPVSDLDGTPQAERLIDAGRSPVSLELAPGDYWVVADLPGYGFHEVLRHVPEPHEMPGFLRHLRWTLRSDTVELRSIRIPVAPVHEGMAFFSGGRSVRMGTNAVPGCIVHHRSVLPYYIETSEFTVGDFRRLCGGALPHRMAPSAPSDDAPLVLVSHDEAVHLAEVVGKRLPDEWEFEFAVTSEAPVPHRSGLAEWTNSWLNQPPYRHLTLGETPYSIRGFRVTREALNSQRGPPSDSVQDFKSAYVRTGVNRRVFSLDSLGFRCARSHRPRLHPSDWTSLV